MDLEDAKNPYPISDAGHKRNIPVRRNALVLSAVNRADIKKNTENNFVFVPHDADIDKQNNARFLVCVTTFRAHGKTLSQAVREDIDQLWDRMADVTSPEEAKRVQERRDYLSQLSEIIYEGEALYNPPAMLLDDIRNKVTDVSMGHFLTLERNI